MSIVSPTDCDCPVFNPSCYSSGSGTASGTYVEFPVAQGNTINQTVTVNGILKVGVSGLQSSSTTPINIGTNTSFATTGINIGQTFTAVAVTGSTISLNPDTATSIGTADILGNNINIGRGDGINDGSVTSLRGWLDLTNGLGTAGQVLTSGGPLGNLTWASGGGSGGGTTVQSGETVVGVGGMGSSVTGSITYVSAYGSKPKIQLTYNLNGTGTTIIPVAVLNHTQFPAGTYTGFTWIAGTTSSTGTISWYAVL